MQKQFTVIACTWFDRSAGNTYHSVRITRHSDGATIAHPWTYGYGSSYEQTALKTMLKSGWLPRKYNEDNVYSYPRQNDYPIIWSVSEGLKRDMVANGEL